LDNRFLDFVIFGLEHGESRFAVPLHDIGADLMAGFSPHNAGTDDQVGDNIGPGIGTADCPPTGDTTFQEDKGINGKGGVGLPDLFPQLGEDAADHRASAEDPIPLLVGQFSGGGGVEFLVGPGPFFGGTAGGTGRREPAAQMGQGSGGRQGTGAQHPLSS
jgi:hypothetical protein